MPSFASDWANGTDQLAGTGDARLLARLILSENLEPPLSIGVFGQQGWGRSFFLHLLQRDLNGLTSNGQRSLVHANFSALLNAETNPWIALVDAVYRVLERDVEKRFAGVDERAHAFTGLGGTAARLRNQARAKVAGAISALDEAKEAVNRAESEHESNMEKLAEEASWQRWHEIEKHHWQPHISEVKSAVASDGMKLGIRGLDERPEDLHNILEQAKSIEGIASLINSSVRSTPWLGTLTTIFVGIAGLAALAGVAYLLYGYLPQIPDYLDALAKALGIFGSVFGAFSVLSLVVLRNRARGALRRLRAHRDRVRNAEREADRNHLLRSARVEEDVAVSRDALTRVREWVQRAQHEHILAKREYEEFLKPGILRRVIEFYRGALVTDGDVGAGIVPVLREDIEALSDWLLLRGSVHRSVGAAATDLPRSTRVVVYIDDLDRCPPERVFAILQAANLLLSTRLFVVVMAMDPIAAMNAIRPRYGELLEQEQPKDIAIDYLARLIQIPFWLTRPSREGTYSLVKQLVAPVAEEVVADEPNPLEEVTPDTGPSESPIPEPSRGEGSEPIESVREVTDADLWFTSDQSAFIQELLGAFPLTPRTIKCFVNLCRLVAVELRAHKRDDHQAFTAIATLLAVVVCVPTVAPLVFELVDDDEIAYPMDFDSRLAEADVPGSLHSAVRETFDVYFSVVGQSEALPLLRRGRSLAARHSFNVPPSIAHGWGV